MHCDVLVRPFDLKKLVGLVASLDNSASKRTLALKRAICTLLVWVYGANGILI